MATVLAQLFDVAVDSGPIHTFLGLELRKEGGGLGLFVSNAFNFIPINLPSPTQFPYKTRSGRTVQKPARLQDYQMLKNIEPN